MESNNNILSSEHFALCPLDGRYKAIADKLAPFFSEYALVKNRVFVELKWLEFLHTSIEDETILDEITESQIAEILKIHENFGIEDYKRIKEIESVTNHDVKAVELFIVEKLNELNLSKITSFVHIGCTSEDISNAAYARMISDSLNQVWIPAAQKLISKLSEMANNYAEVSMLAHTHGQPATPTTVGKELRVFASRMKCSLKHLESIKPKAKFNGATGNYSAISVAFPNENWPLLASIFVSDYLDLSFNNITTQIENHDYICHIADAIRNFNNIVLDLDVDMWLYISKDYFKQVVVASEVGSSTMPHKVNPIRFENSEANIDMSNAVLMALSNKLPRSRMQRDLSDSSSQRNIGLAFGYSLQALEQTLTGLNKVSVNTEKIQDELNSKWEVLAEPIQTVLRKYGVPDAYDKLKELTRGKAISQSAIITFIESLDFLSEVDKKILLDLTPTTYIGIADILAKESF